MYLFVKGSKSKIKKKHLFGEGGRGEGVGGGAARFSKFFLQRI